MGVPPTAAEGCRAAASWSEETVSASCTTPATSVARCITLGRCSTKGDSGTIIEEQCGSSASATERTAYSCSSRSFDERARVAARARSRLSFPVRRIVPASTREVTRPRSRRTSISGVEPKIPSTWKVQHIGYSSASLCSGQRTSMAELAVALRSRASTTFSSLPSVILATASATTDIQASLLRDPSAKRMPTGASGGSASPRIGVAIPPDPFARGDTVVTQATSPRRPTITCGTLSTEFPGSSAKAKVPNATGPVPGSPTSSRTTARETVSVHHLSASANRVGPLVRMRAAIPQPTSPTPARSQQTGSSVGISASSDSACSSASARVRTTRRGTPYSGASTAPGLLLMARDTTRGLVELLDRQEVRILTWHYP